MYSFRLIEMTQRSQTTTRAVAHPLPRYPGGVETPEDPARLFSTETAAVGEAEHHPSHPLLQPCPSSTPPVHPHYFQTEVLNYDL